MQQPTTRSRHNKLAVTCTTQVRCVSVIAGKFHCSKATIQQRVAARLEYTSVSNGKRARFSAAYILAAAITCSKGQGSHSVNIATNTLPTIYPAHLPMSRVTCHSMP